MALITGADSGIGRAVALLYAREGADVAIVHLPEETVDADQVRGEVEREGRPCLLLPGDLEDPAFCREAVERTVAELGGLNVDDRRRRVQIRVDHPDQVRRPASGTAGGAPTWWRQDRPGHRSTRPTRTCPRTAWPTSAARRHWDARPPEEIAPTYVYLASDADSSYTIGEVIAVTGGIVDTR
ncbi:SDR family oxidoreductase [Streptomyces caniscabiei]|uniref:SDR family oxidoreductase n=1 Tax=Streptomyces caniscabiei TaxID=2746961 RepID=UPI0023DBBB4B|nr:SDR family oxidoreductase [Streptomyces caniscabiei]MDX3513221.1 SDR family oxidoreductase [Streptomyces caniscabiei]MDX3718722.1 SDR family oxidoreductase [Streptomyces caniscabiei]WEO21884.1 SDR family oxidoreductase [Streptomyces caniscabiei]